MSTENHATAFKKGDVYIYQEEDKTPVEQEPKEYPVNENFKKRYWVFAFHNHYPAGGLNDLKQMFDELEEAEDLYAEFTDYNHPKYDYHGPQNVQLFDIVDGVILKDTDR